MIREMIDYVLYLHHHQIYIGYISKDNIFVKEGVIMICGHLLTKETNTLSKDQISSRKNKDFLKISRLLVSIFRKNRDEWPRDVDHLLHQLERYRG